MYNIKYILSIYLSINRVDVLKLLLVLTFIRVHSNRCCSYINIMVFIANTYSCAFFADGMVAALLVAKGSARAYVLYICSLHTDGVSAV